jgi:hypothetical protein
MGDVVGFVASDAYKREQREHNKRVSFLVEQFKNHTPSQFDEYDRSDSDKQI